MEQSKLLQGQHLGEKHLLLENSANLIPNWQERKNVKPLNVIFRGLTARRTRDRQTYKHTALLRELDALVWSEYLLMCPSAGMSCEYLKKPAFLLPALLQDLKEIPKPF